MSVSLPPQWRWAILDEVAAPIPNAIVDGPFGSNLKLDDYVEFGIPVLQGKNITHDAFRWTEVRFVSAKKAEELKRSSVRVGDILIVKIGSIGYSAVIDGLNGFDHAIIPANLAKISPDPRKIDTAYLHRWLTSNVAKNYLVRAASTTAQPALSLSKIKALPVPVPPLPEQRRIAEILDKADALRAKRRAALAQLDTLTQSIFLDMFGDPLTHQSDASRVAFKSVTTRITYGFTCPMAHLDSGIPIITAKNVRDGWIDFENVHFADKKEFDQLTEKSKPKVGDVLVTKDGTIGRSVVVGDHGPFCINQSVALIQLDRSKVLPTYMRAYLGSDRVQIVMANMGKGNALAHLQITELGDLPMPLPTIGEQNRFASRLSLVEKVKDEQRLALTHQDALFAALQYRAFRGEL